jgi:hypothetical protein
MTGDDAVLDALDELVRAARQNVTDWMTVLERVDRIRNARAAGVPYREMDVAGRSVIASLAAAQERLAVAAATFRRAAARELRNEGMSSAAIADAFGVSRQRIAALLSNE